MVKWTINFHPEINNKLNNMILNQFKNLNNLKIQLKYKYLTPINQHPKMKAHTKINTMFIYKAQKKSLNLSSCKINLKFKLLINSKYKKSQKCKNKI